MHEPANGSVPGGATSTIRRMSRHPLVIFALLLSLLLQAVSLGGRWAGWSGPANTLHAVLHWSGVAHHHDHQISEAVLDDDADFLAMERELGLDQSHRTGFHQDFSADSSHHIGLDACLGAVGPIPAGLSNTLAVVADTPPALLAQAESPDPFLAGLRRPPKRLA